jgi:hypothetical protein
MQKQEAEKSAYNDVVDAKAASAQNQLAAAQVPDIYSNGKKIIKTANFRFQTENVKQTITALEQSIRKYNGYIETSNLKLDNPILESRMTIRVQNDFFDELLNEIDLQAVFVNFRNIATDDVSKDFVDLDSRLKTKREVEQRYIQILRSKAGTIEELLDAEQKIGALHEEIEATISRINYLKDQVSYSTINLEFYQTIKQEVAAVEEPGFIRKAGDALGVGWSGVTDITIGLLHIWPLLLLSVAGIYFIYRKRKSFSAITPKS